MSWLFGVLGLLALVACVWPRLGVDHIDMEVYRAGGRAWSNGLPLYVSGFDRDLAGPGLPFTYPPIAAVLFWPLDILGPKVAVATLGLLGLLALGITCVLALPARRLGVGACALVLFALALVGRDLEPVMQTLQFGQINLVLMGLVALDCLLPRTWWPRGSLIGLAAAIKLTPAAFVLFFIARGQWRPALQAGAAFIAFGLLGWLLAPADSLTYWLHTVSDPTRVGGLAHASNQSLRGALTRLAPLPGMESALWLVLVMAVVVLGVVAVRRHRDDRALALLLVATTALLISPVSWSHHWVWVAPAIALFGHRAWKRRDLRLGGMTALVAAVFVAGPHWLLRREHDVELTWNVLEHLLGNSYLIIGLLLLITAVARPGVLAAGSDRHSAERGDERGEKVSDEPATVLEPAAAHS